MTMSEDMLAEGLVRSLARPEGNTTGISILSTELNGKRQDLLIEATPNARKIAALNDATVLRSEQIRVLKEAANKRGIELAVFDVSKPEDIGPAVDGAKEAGAKALNFLASSLFFPMAPAALEHINRARLPAIFHWPEMAERGGLLGYGTAIYRSIPPTRAADRQGAARCQACGHSGRTTNPLRTGHQPSNRKGDRPRNPGWSGAARR